VQSIYCILGSVRYSSNILVNPCLSQKDLSARRFLFFLVDFSDKLVKIRTRFEHTCVPTLSAIIIDGISFWSELINFIYFNLILSVIITSSIRLTTNIVLILDCFS